MFTTFSKFQNVKAHVVFGDKALIDAAFHSDSMLHMLFGRALIRHVIDSYTDENFRKVVVIFDQALPKRKQGDFQGIIKRELKALGKPFHVYFHRMVTDMNGQIADYVAWSKFVLIERNEGRPWQSIQASIMPTDAEIRGDGTD